MDLGLRVSTAYFNGLQALKGTTAVLQGSIAYFSGLEGLHLSRFVKTAMEIVWVPELQAVKMMGFRAKCCKICPCLSCYKICLV